MSNNPTLEKKREKVLAVWLLSVAVMVLFMVILGGLTRLTHSGLSMVEWKLFSGWIPPLNDADWQALFAKYQIFPEFHKTNPNMDVNGFKSIFWLEFVHRVWGRLLGFAFFIPFAVFFVKGWYRVSDGLFWKFVGLFVLGGSQGLMGWFMVMSGLVDRPDVSQYRLTAHFALALLIIIALIWVALGLLKKEPHDHQHQEAGALGGMVRGLFGLAFLTALSGGFVAGLDAGLVYNTFPLMDGGLIPGGLFDFDPWYMAPFEDVTTVQFDHRTLASATFTVVMIIWFKAKNRHLAPSARRAINALAILACLQVTLGISTLLLVVPVSLASMHQFGAVILLSMITWCLHELRSPPQVISSNEPV